ncbi:MAG: adenylyltransferase/cytidyltransferase family protein [Eggerthellaceae bacterium]
MTTVITYGTYDLLHYGHIRLLERAKALGDKLIVGVTADAYDQERGKLNVQQSTLERVEAIKATGLADQVIIEEYEGQKIADIQKYDVDIFAIGSDWRGKFDYIGDYCKVVYLERTRGVSSTEIRAASNPMVKCGIRGINRISKKFFEEMQFVSGIEADCAISDDSDFEDCFDGRLNIVDSYDEFYEGINAVAIFDSIDRHFDAVMDALNHGCHVLCAGPLFMNEAEAKEAFALAEEKGLVIFDAVKTLYFPAFEHLLLLIASGHIGQVKSIDVSCSQIPSDFDPKKATKFDGALYDWGGLASLPIVKILGTDYKDIEYFVHREGEADLFTQCLIRYDDAVASFKVGKGVKTEGNMVITGTKGYVYVAAPWWKIDYFEVRHEDLRATRREFYRYAGEGLRYEALEFVRTINSGNLHHRLQSEEEILCEVRIVEAFSNQ